MESRESLNHWAREAVSLALYECALGAAAQFAQDAVRVQEEAAWISPPSDLWALWQARRKVCDEAALWPRERRP